MHRDHRSAIMDGANPSMKIQAAFTRFRFERRFFLDVENDIRGVHRIVIIGNIAYGYDPLYPFCK